MAEADDLSSVQARSTGAVDASGVQAGSAGTGETVTEVGESDQPLELLLAVQRHDLLLDQLAYRRRGLTERQEVGDIDRESGALAIRQADTRSQLSELESRQVAIESQVKAYSSRIAAIEARLTQGGAFREMQAMNDEARSLERHRSALEDTELEVMEAIEPIEREVNTLEAELGALRARRAVVEAALGEAERQLDAEAADVRREREQLAARLPSALAADYERLRGRLGGIGAARLADGACGGCHLKLPSSERDRLVHATRGEVFHCDQCGRILVA
jgi:predicted  nucleic acid-binding Zn-ribbon protein